MADQSSGISDETIDGSERITLAQSSMRSGTSGPFDLSGATIPRNEIVSGGPPKDGIPALSTPEFIAATKATYLGSQDRVIGFSRGQEARAYPLKILNYHEIVNDRVGGAPVAITYCPLCDSAAVFDRRTSLGEREFGVSGLLYNSNVLMYDRSGQVDSLWSQVKAEGVSGPGAKTKLKALPLQLTTWSDWVARYPETLVLSPQTGHARNYDRDPYAGYFHRPQLMFPARPTSDRLPTKERVLGVWTDGVARAYPVSAFGTDRRQIVQEIDGKRVVIEFDPTAQSLRVADAEEGVECMYSLWFAWHAFRPQTEVFQ
ncbi:MAG: DUF3179 domain-containing protein [Pirellulales bacterium]